MGELIILMGLLLVFAIPLITGFFARRMGRRFWLWFLIAMVLPVIASFILFFLPDLSEPNEIEQIKNQ